MKKILSIISLIMVLAVLAVTPALALESDVPSMALDYALDAANEVKIIAVPSADKSPMADGMIEEGEYAYSYKEERDAIPTTNSDHSVIAADYNANVNAAIAKEFVDMEPLILGTEIEYFFAEDDERIYVGVKYQPGVEYELNADGTIATETFGDQTFKKIKNILSRGAMTYRIGFNLDDPDEYIQLGVINMVRWDLMVDSVEKKFVSAGVGVDIGYDGVIEQAYRQIIADETGWLNNEVANDKSSVVLAGDIIDHNNPGTAHTIYDEFVINKEALLTCMSDYSGATYDGVPNAFFFSAAANGQVIGQIDAEGNRGWASSGGAGFYSWNGTPTKNTEVSLREIFPDLVVFTDSTTVTKDDVKIVELAVETDPVETDPVETDPVDDTEPAGDDTEATEPVAGNDTEPTDTEPAEGGCGSSVSLMGLALVAALGTCAVFTAKKKEN